MIRQGPLGYFPMLAWLLPRRCHARCCLRPRGVGRHSSLSHLPFCLRLLSRDRHFPNNSYSRGYVSDSGHTLFTSLDSRIAQMGGHTTGRLTKPYPGGVMLSHSPRNVEPEPGSNDNVSLRSDFRKSLPQETLRNRLKCFRDPARITPYDHPGAAQVASGTCGPIQQ